MKKTDFIDIPICANCDAQAIELHELAGGKTNVRGNSKRDLCITYDLQLPLCRKCHNEFENQKKKSFDWCCKLLDIDTARTRAAIEYSDLFDLRQICARVKKNFWTNYNISRESYIK